jgi:Ser/Thr protein kinase RdoA (MazF antagonist)
MLPERVAAWFMKRYDIASSSATCRLIRSYTNDVYLIQTPPEKFVLKVYGLGWRTPAEVQYEIDLLQHLSARGVPVATPIAAADQEVLQSIASPAGRRIAVLFAYVPGEKPQPPFRPALYEEFGRAIARFHQVADDFVTSYPRRACDETVLIDEPVALAAALLSNPNERAWLHQLASALKDRITAFAAAGLDWGPIHGDASLDNLHVTDDGKVILYDFDSGGPGWRAADLQGWAANNAGYHACWDAFHRGYNRVRPLGEVDRMAAPYLTLAWDMWGLKIDLERRIIAQGPEQVQQYLNAQLGQLRSRITQSGLAFY